MARVKKPERIYKRVRKGDRVYVLTRNRYTLPPFVKEYKIERKYYSCSPTGNEWACSNPNSSIKYYYLYYHCGVINLQEQEVYTSKSKAQRALVKAYRYFVKNKVAQLNETKRGISIREEKIVNYKSNLKKMERKFGV